MYHSVVLFDSGRTVFLSHSLSNTYIACIINRLLSHLPPLSHSHLLFPTSITLHTATPTVRLHTAASGADAVVWCAFGEWSFVHLPCDGSCQ